MGGLRGRRRGDAARRRGRSRRPRRVARRDGLHPHRRAPARIPYDPMNVITVRVPAKVNLQLAVGPVRDDGYHDLVNVFHAVSLFDEVTAAPADALTVTVDGPPGVPLGPENLAARAAALLARHAGVAPNVALHIRKDIPVAGGMA